MSDVDTIELHKTTKTVEGSRAQANIVRDLFEGRELNTDITQTQLERYYRTFLVQHSRVAYQEMVDVIGLSADRLFPVKEAGVVKLESEDKNKLADYLFRRNHSRLKNLRGVEGDLKIFEKLIAIAETVHNVEPDEYDVELIGPIIRMTFKNMSAYSRFADSLGSAGSSGLFFPLPLGDDDKGKQINSTNTFISCISPAEMSMGEESSDQHEKYHVIDYFRSEQLKKIAGANPRDSSIRTTFAEDDRFKERLKDYFFDPEMLVESLDLLRSQAPKAYGYYCGIGITGGLEDFSSPFLKKAFIDSFSHIQREVPAYIAGFLNPKNPVPFTDLQRNKIIMILLEYYMPFGKVKVAEMEARSTRDEKGRFIVDVDKIDEDLQKQAGEKDKEEVKTQKASGLSKGLGNRDESYKALEEMVSQIYLDIAKRQRIDMLRHYDGNKELYITDVQRLIDFFLNEGGQGYETMEHIKRNLTDAMNAYRELATLRNNPYQALIEISLIPLSHWASYTNRQKDLSDRKK